MADPLEIFRRQPVVAGGEVRQLEIEIAGEHRPERQVGLQILVPELEFEAALCAVPLEIHRQEDERGEPLGVRRLAFVPAQEAHAEEEDADALLFFQGTGFAEERDKPFLQLFRRQPRLELGVDVVGPEALLLVFAIVGKPDSLVVYRLIRGSGGRAAQGREGHFLALLAQDLEDFVGPFVLDVELIAALLADGRVRQAVALADVEQLLAELRHCGAHARNGTGRGGRGGFAVRV